MCLRPTCCVTPVRPFTCSKAAVCKNEDSLLSSINTSPWYIYDNRLTISSADTSLRIITGCWQGFSCENKLGTYVQNTIEIDNFTLQAE